LGLATFEESQISGALWGVKSFVGTTKLFLLNKRQKQKFVNTFEELLLSGFIIRHNFLTLLWAGASFGGCFLELLKFKSTCFFVY